MEVTKELVNAVDVDKRGLVCHGVTSMKVVSPGDVESKPLPK